MPAPGPSPSGYPFLASPAGGPSPAYANGSPHPWGAAIPGATPQAVPVHSPGWPSQGGARLPPPPPSALPVHGALGAPTMSMPPAPPAQSGQAVGVAWLGAAGAVDSTTPVVGGSGESLHDDAERRKSASKAHMLHLPVVAYSDVRTSGAFTVLYYCTADTVSCWSRRGTLFV